MNNLTLRHYNVTLAYRTRAVTRTFDSLRLRFRSRISLRQFRANLRALLPLRLLTN